MSRHRAQASTSHESSRGTVQKFAPVAFELFKRIGSKRPVWSLRSDPLTEKLTCRFGGSSVGPYLEASVR